MDRGAWQAIQSKGLQESDMTELLNHHLIYIYTYVYMYIHTHGIFFLLHFTGLDHLFP